MKTNQLILAAAIIAIAGCAKSNVIDNVDTESNEIGFNAVTAKATKANTDIVTSTAYPEDNSFGIWAFNSAAGDWSEFEATTPSNFMTGLKIEKTTGRDNTRPEAWRNAANYYYWPYTGAIAFIACHPFEVVPTVKYGGATIGDYTISNSNKTVDLMFASATGNRTTNASTPVSLAFKHALSQIYFTIKTDADYTVDDVTFEVNSITIKNIDLSGDVTYNKTTINWEDNDTQTQNWTYCDDDVNATHAGVAYGSAIVMIPQAANAQTILTIAYTMTQNTIESSGSIDVPASQAWAVNGKYQYILNFKLSEILFSPGVTDWAELTVIEKEITL